MSTRPRRTKAAVNYAEMETNDIEAPASEREDPTDDESGADESGADDEPEPKHRKRYVAPPPHETHGAEMYANKLGDLRTRKASEPANHKKRKTKSGKQGLRPLVENYKEPDRIISVPEAEIEKGEPK